MLIIVKYAIYILTVPVFKSHIIWTLFGQFKKLYHLNHYYIYHFKNKRPSCLIHFFKRPLKMNSSNSKYIEKYVKGLFNFFLSFKNKSWHERDFYKIYEQLETFFAGSLPYVPDMVVPCRKNVNNMSSSKIRLKSTHTKMFEQINTKQNWRIFFSQNNEQL